MPFKDLEQKHNLVNRVILACGKHPTDADINPLLEERLERFYEDATVEGMSMQMMRSVDRAVNAMVKPWQGLTEDEQSIIYNDLYTQYTRDDVNIADFILIARTIELQLKEKNGG